MKKLFFYVFIGLYSWLYSYEVNLDDSIFKPSSKYDNNIALFGAYVSEKAYSDNYGEINNYLDGYGFRNIYSASISLGITDAQLLVATKEIILEGKKTNLILIAFRGTELSKVKDILTDLDITKQTFTDGYAKVHKGFFDSMKKVKLLEDGIGLEDNANYMSIHLKGAIENAKNSNEIFLIVGHSLGGAIATLYAADLINRGVPKSKILVYTYGSPAVGDENFVSRYDGNIFYHRIRNEYDPVPFSIYIDTLIDTWNRGVDRVDRAFSSLLEDFPHITNLSDIKLKKYPYKHIGYMRVFDKNGKDITNIYPYMLIHNNSGDLLINFKEHSLSKYISNLESYAEMVRGLEGKTFSWNGNASVVSYNSGYFTGFGLTKDVTKIHGNSKNNPVVFFQWQRDKNDGKNLKIYVDDIYYDHYTTATICYGPWNSSYNKKKTYENVALPFILDPTKDGFSGENKAWFTIAVSFNKKPISKINVRAEATDEESINTIRSIFINKVNLDNEYYWSGNGSLISYGSGDLKGYGLTYDIAVVYPDIEIQRKPTIFLQWEIDSSDGKKVKITSDNKCVNKVRITTGYWYSRNSDKSIITTLPYTISTSAEDGSWKLIRVDLLDKPLCKDYIRAKIIY